MGGHIECCGGPVKCCRVSAEFCRDPVEGCKGPVECCVGPVDCHRGFSKVLVGPCRISLRPQYSSVGTPIFFCLGSSRVLLWL